MSGFLVVLAHSAKPNHARSVIKGSTKGQIFSTIFPPKKRTKLRRIGKKSRHLNEDDDDENDDDDDNSNNNNNNNNNDDDNNDNGDNTLFY